MSRYHIVRLLIVTFTPAFIGNSLSIGAELQPVKIEGVVLDVGREGLVLRTEQGVDYTVSVNPQRIHQKTVYQGLPEPQVSVTGPGLPEQVLTGVFVDLEMDLTPRRESRNVIEALRIVSREDTLPGCFRRQEGEVRLEPTPFAQVGEGKYRVVGQLTLLGNNAAIAVPEGVIRCRIANNPKIQLEVSDHRFALRGDRATLVGFSPGLPFVFATELRVKRSEQPQVPAKGEPVAEVAPVKPPAEPAPAGDNPDAPAPTRKPLTILKVN